MERDSGQRGAGGPPGASAEAPAPRAERGRSRAAGDMEADAGSDRYAVAFQRLGRAIVIADRDGRFVDVNRRACELSGYTREELLRLSVPDLAPGDGERTRATYGAFWRRLRMDGGSRTASRGVRRKDGTVFDADADVLLLDDDTLLAVIADASERRRAQAALRGSEERYRTLFDNVPIGLFRAGRDRRLTDANFTLVRMLGFPDRATLFATDADELFVRPTDRRALETLLAERGYAEQFELRLRRYDGEPIWVRVNVRARPDADGAVAGYEGAVMDITERRRAEDALRESEERYRLLFEQDLTGNFVTTPDGRLLACNPAFVEIFGFDSVEHALELGVDPLNPDRAAREAFLERIRRDGKAEVHATMLQRLDGTVVHLVENAYGTFDADGELIEVRGHLFDVTEQRQLEEQLRQAQKMEAIGRLAGGIAHDFNNLMMTVQGYAQLTLQDLDDASPVRDDLEEIVSAVDRANSLTRQLLAFGRKQVMNPRVFELNELLHDLQKMLRRLIGEDVRLVTRAEAANGRVKADPGQLEQVILNLVLNARDAMPEGGTLTIRTAERAMGASTALRLGLAGVGGYIVLTVEDTGVGMAPEVRERIFEPFFTTKSKGKGTGLGLATVYGIVKQSGGAVRVESEVGRGTVFEVCLPSAGEEGGEPAAGDGDAAIEAIASGAPAGEPSPVHDEAEPDGDGEAGPASHGRERVLLVEDEAPVRALIRRVLDDAGYHVVEAEDGRHALDVAAAIDGPIDVLVTDVVMPELGGRELAERLVRDRPTMAILFLSGYSEAAVQSYGVFDMDAIFCPKPIRPAALRRKVREAIDARGADDR